jgi:hypothetical protein
LTFAPAGVLALALVLLELLLLLLLPHPATPIRTTARLGMRSVERIDPFLLWGLTHGGSMHTGCVTRCFAQGGAPVSVVLARRLDLAQPASDQLHAHYLAEPRAVAIHPAKSRVVARGPSLDALVLQSSSGLCRRRRSAAPGYLQHSREPPNGAAVTAGLERRRPRPGAVHTARRTTAI